MSEIKYKKELKELVDMLVDLHLLFEDGKNDSDGAEVLRDRMDVPWYKMDGDEIDLTNRMSSDLYNTEPHPELEWSVRKKLAMDFLKERYEILK